MKAVSWGDVTIAIPTMPQRRDALAELLSQIENECPGAAVVVREHQEGDHARVDLPLVLHKAAEVGRPWILQFEDDVQLCPNFENLALLHGLDGSFDAMTIFSRRQDDLARYERGERVYATIPRSFAMAQAFFLRGDLAKGVADFAPGWYLAHPEKNRAASTMMGEYFAFKRARFAVRIPSLVQHKRLESTIRNRGVRQSETYKRVFGEV